MRLTDNHALYGNIGKVIYPIFIFDPKQIDKVESNSHYFGKFSVQFLLGSLVDLNR